MRDGCSELRDGDGGCLRTERWLLACSESPSCALTCCPSSGRTGWIGALVPGFQVQRRRADDQVLSLEFPGREQVTHGKSSHTRLEWNEGGSLLSNEVIRDSSLNVQVMCFSSSDNDETLWDVRDLSHRNRWSSVDPESAGPSKTVSTVLSESSKRSDIFNKK